MDASNYPFLPEVLDLEFPQQLEDPKYCKLAEGDASIWDEVLQYFYLERQRQLSDTLSANQLGTPSVTYWEPESDQRFQGTYDSDSTNPSTISAFEFTESETDSLSTLSSSNEYLSPACASPDAAVFIPQSSNYPSPFHQMATAVDGQQHEIPGEFQSQTGYQSFSGNYDSDLSGPSTISNFDSTESEIGPFSQSEYLSSGSASPDVTINTPQLTNHPKRRLFDRMSILSMTKDAQPLQTTAGLHWYPRFNPQFLGNYNSESGPSTIRFDFAESTNDSSSTSSSQIEYLSSGGTSPDVEIYMPQMSNHPWRQSFDRMAVTTNNQQQEIPGQSQWQTDYQLPQGNYNPKSGPSTHPSFKLPESETGSSSTLSSPTGYPSPDVPLYVPQLSNFSSRKRSFNQMATTMNNHPYYNDTRPPKRLRQPTSMLPLAEKRKRPFPATDLVQLAACTEAVRLRNRLMLSVFGLRPPRSHYPELFNCMWDKNCPYIFDGHIKNSNLVRHFRAKHGDTFGVQAKSVVCRVNGCKTDVLAAGYEKHLRPAKAQKGVVHGPVRLCLPDTSWKTTKFLLKALKRAGYVFSFRNAGPDDWLHREP